MNFILLGNLSKDHIYTENNKINQTGGPIFYQAQVFSDFKERVGICTKFNELPKQLKNKYIDTTGFIKTKPTLIDIFEEKEKCYGLVRQYAGQIDFQDIPQQYFKAKYFIISTIFDDLNITTIKRIKKEYPKIKICLDIQGYLRPKKLNIPIQKRKIDLTFLKGIEILKFNQAEFDIEFKSQKIGIDILNKIGVSTYLLTEGAKSIKLYYRGKFYEYQPKIIKTQNTVGAGDILLACFVYYLGANVKIKKALPKSADYVSKKLSQKNYV